MGAARKMWEDAKAKVKNPQDWEAQLHLSDTYASNLDSLQKLIEDASGKAKSLESDIRKLESMTAAVVATAKKYRHNLMENAASGRLGASTGLRPSDIKILGSALDDAGKTALSTLRESVRGTGNFPTGAILRLLSD